jgi:predicted nucleic acid-binding protein
MFSSFYFDTNVILDVINERKPASKELIQLIKLKNLTCGVSYFGIMESLDILHNLLNVSNKLKEKERLDKICRDHNKSNKRKLTSKELDDEYKRIYILFMEYYKSCIKYEYLTDKGWYFAVDIMREHNISAVDAIHIATAKMADYDMFVSSDIDLIQVSKKIIESYIPEKAIKKIE